MNIFLQIFLLWFISRHLLAIANEIHPKESPRKSFAVYVITLSLILNIELTVKHHVQEKKIQELTILLSIQSPEVKKAPLKP